MPLFQPSVLNKYISDLDKPIVNAAFAQFKNYFGNAEIQNNIREAKEEQFQEGFLRELFVKILGYTINPDPNFNLLTELKNETGAKKADGAILKDGNAIKTKITAGVIVQITSNQVPCTKYLCDISLFELL